MSDDEKYFRDWYVAALAPLRSNGDAGFIFAFVSLPLLERYLREKSGAGQVLQLPIQFYLELRALFPEIAGKENDLWHCYRNGLLHQAAFSKEKIRHGICVVMPSAGLSGHDSRPVYYDVPTDSFYMNPVVFFDRVTGAILADFATYLGSLSPAHKLPTIVAPSTAVPYIVPTIGAYYPGATGSYHP